MAISYQFIQKIIENITPILPQQRIEKIGQISPTDFYFTLSKTREHAFFISLNQPEPLLGLIDKSMVRHQITSTFYQQLKKLLDHAFIHSLELLENNRVVCLRLSTTSPIFVTEEKTLYIELISQQPNLVLVDHLGKILLVLNAKTDLNNKRPLMRQLIYHPPLVQANFPRLSKDEELLLTSRPDNPTFLNTPTLYLVDNKPSSLPAEASRTRTITLNQYVQMYLSRTELMRKKQLNSPLFLLINRRIKSLNHKLSVLDKEKENALTHQKDVEKGNILLTYKDSLQIGSKVIIDGFEIQLDETKSIVENANALFRSYRKAKQALYHLDIQQTQAQEELGYLHSLRIHLENASLDEAKVIERELIEVGIMKQSLPFKKPIDTASKMPYFVFVDGCKIGFGHNHTQNDYLTFTLAKPNHYFIHTLHYPGAHVVIMDDHPSQSTLLLASSMALRLSKLTTGEVMIARKKDVKKLGHPGQVKVEKYQTLRIVNLVSNTDDVLQSASRAA